ncbi:virulence factor [Enterobacteriales bacterium SAP-6]|uniref:Virulence factor n=2 Tax=Acerihabitans arboris TaxID=2691583 RepID=A0A845SPR8_9GAMM|nr:virulence factor [Acerihabitans arboris]
MQNQLPNPLQNQLHNRLHGVLEGIDRAIDWIAATRRHAPRLDMEAGRLGIRLRRCRTQARYLYNASHGETAIGFYGQSARGKLHLIAALAAGQDGALTTELGGKRLDVLSLIEPQSRTTGLALRFSRRRPAENSAYPVQLKLLGEADLGMIMVNIFMDGTGPDTAGRDLGDQALDDCLDRLLTHRQAEPVAGMSGDRVVELWDYVSRHDRRRQKQLEIRFWPLAVELAPYLSVEDRAELFSVLWQQRADLTVAYRHFAAILQHLDGASYVMAPLGVLVDDNALRADGILDNAMLARLYTAADPLIQVAPILNGGAATPVELSMAELAMLAVELLIPLDAPARASLGEPVDLIDFAGIGGSLERVTTPAIPQENAIGVAYPLAPALLRARRAYLPERYADRQDVNLLMVCTAATQRPEVAAAGKLLDYWVRSTQVENTRLGGRRKPGLIWALTRFDQRVVQGRNHDEAVQRYIGNPGDTWGTLLAMDPRGINSVVAYLAAEATRDAKLRRLNEQTHELQRELAENLLGGWHQAANEDPLQKQPIANTLLKALQARAGMHGELLGHLLPAREELRRLYLQTQPDRAGAAEPGHPGPDGGMEPFGLGVTLDLLSDPPTGGGQGLSAAGIAGAGHETNYARKARRYWINHLRGLPDNGPLLALLGISRPTMEILMTELITAAIRLDIAGSLDNILVDSGPPGLPADGKADRQAARVLAVLGDFVAWLGFTQVSEAQRPDSRINPGHKIFARLTPSSDNWGAANRLARLDAVPVNNTAFYVYDWLVGLNTLIRQNAGYAGGSEIGPAQRERLGAIIRLINPASN